MCHRIHISCILLDSGHVWKCIFYTGSCISTAKWSPRHPLWELLCPLSATFPFCLAYCPIGASWVPSQRRLLHLNLCPGDYFWGAQTKGSLRIPPIEADRVLGLFASGSSHPHVRHRHSYSVKDLHAESIMSFLEQ